MGVSIAMGVALLLVVALCFVPALAAAGTTVHERLADSPPLCTWRYTARVLLAAGGGVMWVFSAS